MKIFTLGFVLAVGAAVSAFSYDDLLQAPRRSPAIPNKAGTTAAFTESTYSFSSHSWNASLKLVSLETGTTKAILDDANDVGDFAWAGIDAHTLLYLNESSAYTELWSLNINSGKTKELYSFPGSVSLLKTRITPSGVRVVVSGWAAPDGSLLSPDAPAKHDTGLLYDTIFVRHWDYWLTENRKSVFGLLLSEKDLSNVKEPFTNYLKALRIESPIMPFPSSSDFDLHDDILVVNAKAPELNPATNTATYFYAVNYTSSNTRDIPLNKAGYGACSSPTISRDGKKVAGLVQLENGYESDQNIVFVYELAANGTASSVKNVTYGKTFDRSPSSVVWSPDEDNVLYLTGEDTGREVLWRLDLSEPSGIPVLLNTTHSVESAEFIKSSSSKLLLSSSAIVKSTYYEIFDMKSNSTTLLLDASASVKENRVGEFWFTGSRGVQVHGFIMYPSHFDSRKKYPLAFLIHGGPQSAWTDAWSTRWNPIVWSDNGDEGYIVVTINPTGSTSYGKDFTDKIQNNWGSYPYIDLVLGLEYVTKKYTFIDTERMIAAGASYGGYMVNWIQGSALGRVFKALVTHDGVFSTLNQYASEELYFPIHDFGGSFLKNTRGYYKFNPMNRMYRWATPHFIVHNAKDYRLPESEGLLAFNVLQELGVPSKLLHFPDENHWVLKPENSRRWHKEIFDFINYWSGSGFAMSVHEGETVFGIKSTATLLAEIAETVDSDVEAM
ncbi:Alpha/Beta hydrolase protein [Lipomyces orientalis]|uniref:Alpha/Beta hydrolase protein n=1 Tax=Lipomyces orientalis TaxID=1233043 RepID=A0ACC3TVC7_9ASCO